jgi:hypothetical protein
MSAARKGVPKSEITRQKMSLSRQDPNTPANRARREATSRNNVQRNQTGKDFNVKGHYPATKAKSSPVAYRSTSIELRLMQQFDADPKVLTWESPLTVAYQNVDGSLAHALPDFLVEFTDGTRRVVEGKGPHLLTRYLTGPKFAAVQGWCRREGVPFSVVTTARDRSLVWMDIPC